MFDHLKQLFEFCCFKKLPRRSNKTEIPIDLSLKMSPSCHILSKAIARHIKKNLQDARVGYASKAL